ncbi:hypothetical protein AF72_02185 [Xylella taiwanensis]|uniref:Uncharacterized protein n=1 Tax=Xylella taiwanensis TaxID=1444770 RepID=Z9JLP6_9GAMM|nr:hypothetical protein AF72_02185 [Xylella taiwanensis]
MDVLHISILPMKGTSALVAGESSAMCWFIGWAEHTA